MDGTFNLQTAAIARIKIKLFILNYSLFGIDDFLMFPL